MQVAYKVFLLLALALLIVIPRVLDLDAFRSPDEDRWMARTVGFTEDLAYGNFGDLLKSPTPGITTQWLGSLTARFDDWGQKKLSLVLGQCLLIAAVGYIFWRLWGNQAGAIVTLLLAINPALTAHSRVYGTDSLVSLFILLSLGCLLLWRRQIEGRYLVFAALAAAAAVLSKIPAILLVPFSAGLITYWQWPSRSNILRANALWGATFIIGLGLLLPSFIIAPFDIIGDFLEIFRSTGYTELHTAGPLYYVESLTFFSTPLHLALAAVFLIAYYKIIPAVAWQRITKEQLAILMLFGALFWLQMTVGAKKGDRYILPVLVIFDVIAAGIIVKLYQLRKKVLRMEYQVSDIKKYLIQTTYYLLLVTIAWQALIVWQLYPHTLAYVNPITRPWFGDRRHGWGEGLDVAAEYLNQKPSANHLKVATYYPVEFDHYFVGEAVPAHQHEESSIDYVIIYRAMFERGADAWETDVRNAYSGRPPEKVITLSGIPMAWIYAKEDN